MELMFEHKCGLHGLQNGPQNNYQSKESLESDLQRERKISMISDTDVPKSSSMLDVPLSLMSSPTQSPSPSRSHSKDHSKNCFDELSLSMSSSSSEFDLPGSFEITNMDGRSKKSAHFFLESSRLSISSEDDDDDDDEDVPSLLELILSDTSLDDYALYNDWDSGLSNSSGEFQRDEAGSWRNRMNGNTSEIEILDFPHRALRFMECEICMEMSYLRRRMCCDFQSCNKCLSMYLSGKVKDGKVQIECLNDRCHVLMSQAEIRHRLCVEMREKFKKFLIDANNDPHIKTCPSCSNPFTIDPARLKISKKKLKQGIQVTCTQCRLVWCFRCQAPFHTNMTCKKFKNGDEMLKRWAKEVSYGQTNAQKCPKCKVFVQKVDGCDHMKCSQCDTNFCYRCGDRYISVKFFGSHWNRFSLFGCKYRLMPEKTGLRRFIRGAHFVGRLFGAVVFAALGVAAGAVLIAGSGIVLPGYGIVLLRRRMVAAKKRRMFNRIKLRMIDEAERRMVEQRKFQGILETVVEESETETSDPVPDPQQVQVMVHRPDGPEEAATVVHGNQNQANCSVIVNNYTDDRDSSVPNNGTSSSQCTSFKGENQPPDTNNDDEELVYEEADIADLKVLCNSTSCFEGEHRGRKSDSECGGDSCSIKCEQPNGKLDGKKGEKEFKVEPETTEPLGGVDMDSHNRAVMKDKVRSDNSDSISNSARDGSKNKKGDELMIVTVVNKCSDTKLLDCDEGISLAGDRNGGDENCKQSFPKVRIASEDKVTKSKAVKDTDKISTTDKVDGETAGKGCFGNIFNVAKRSTAVTTSGIVNNNMNEEGVGMGDVNKPDKTVNVTVKQKNGFLATTKKADTWEKCRRSKVEIDAGLKSSIDSVSEFDYHYNHNHNHIPLVHKSPSSLSSIIGFTFNNMEDSTRVKKEVISSDCPLVRDDVVGDFSDNEDKNSVGRDVSVSVLDEGRSKTLEQSCVSQTTLVTHL